MGDCATRFNKDRSSISMASKFISNISYIKAYFENSLFVQECSK